MIVCICNWMAENLLQEQEMWGLFFFLTKNLSYITQKKNSFGSNAINEQNAATKKLRNKSVRQEPVREEQM